MAADNAPPAPPPPVPAAALDRRLYWSLVAAVALLMTLLGGLGLNTASVITNHQTWVVHTQEVQLEVERLRAALRGAGRAALDGLGEPGQGADAPPLDTWLAGPLQHWQRLRELVVDNPPQQAALDNLLPELQHHMRLLAGLRALPVAERGAALDRRRSGIERLEQRLDQYNAIEGQLRRQRLQRVADALRDQRWLLLGATLGSLAVVAAAALRVSAGLARGDRLAHSAQAQVVQLQSANQHLGQQVADRARDLDLAAAALRLRGECQRLLLAAVDAPDELPVLQAWRQQVLDSGLAQQVQLDLNGLPRVGEVGTDAGAPGHLLTLALPDGLGSATYRRRRPLQADDVHLPRAADMLTDLAAWLQLRAQRRLWRSAEQARERLDRQLAALFELSPLGVAMLDMHFAPQRLNPRMQALCSLLGPADQGQQHLCHQLRPWMEQVREQGEPVMMRALQIQPAVGDGSVLHWRVSLLPLRDPPSDQAYGLAMLVLDVTAQEQAQQRLTGVGRQLLEMAEDERRTLARELHDDLGQRLAALKLNLQLLIRPGASAELQALLGPDSVALVDGAIAQVRERAASLRPPQLDELGLAQALRSHAQQQAARSGVAVHLQMDLPGPWDMAWAAQVFRIVQEALRNAIDHGQPQRVDIRLQAAGGDQVLLELQDDGRGIAPQAPTRGLGLLGMRERTELLGGHFEVAAVADGGTCVRCHWPASVTRPAPHLPEPA